MYICEIVKCSIKAVARGGATGACAPPFKKKNKKKNPKSYFLCRIIRFYTNNRKCQYVYLSYYLNDYQIIDATGACAPPFGP